MVCCIKTTFRENFDNLLESNLAKADQLLTTVKRR